MVRLVSCLLLGVLAVLVFADAADAGIFRRRDGSPRRPLRNFAGALFRGCRANGHHHHQSGNCSNGACRP